jgi:ADP-ribose pyrophosphatase YjhB (NUDIX family)
MDRHFCSTVCIVEQQRVLLVFHRKLNKWLFPGGHLDLNETPAEGARREVREETGLEIEFIRQENVWVERWNASSFERPYLCLLEEIPAYKDTPAHQHMDFIYLARPIGGVEQQNPEETNGLRWFTLKEIEALKPDEEIFVETHEIIHKILEDMAFDKINRIGKQQATPFTGYSGSTASTR